MVKLVKDTKLKVQAAIQGDEVRITGKQRDDLQDAIQTLKEADFGHASPVRQLSRMSAPSLRPRSCRRPLVLRGRRSSGGDLEWPRGRSRGGLGVDADPAQRCRSRYGPVAGGVVVAHPHPLHGGTMAQPVVYRIARACREQRLATLRFNFRGVGGSAGTFSGTEEYRDVEAAAAFLRGRLAALDR